MEPGAIELTVTPLSANSIDKCFVAAIKLALDNNIQVAKHKIVTQALHTGRYAHAPNAVAPSAIKAPINPFTPEAVTADEIEEQIQDFVNCAKLAQQAAYDGVEIMGSEGYLINQFIAPRTNRRKDEWGGSFDNRIRFPLEIVNQIREAVGVSFIIIFPMIVG